MDDSDISFYKFTKDSVSADFHPKTGFREGEVETVGFEAEKKSRIRQIPQNSPNLGIHNEKSQKEEQEGGLVGETLLGGLEEKVKKSACQVCRARKKRCDGRKPFCTYCVGVKKTSECTYPAPRNPSAAKKKSGKEGDETAAKKLSKKRVKKSEKPHLAMSHDLSNPLVSNYMATSTTAVDLAPFHEYNLQHLHVAPNHPYHYLQHQSIGAPYTLLPILTHNNNPSNGQIALESQRNSSLPNSDLATASSSLASTPARTESSLSTSSQPKRPQLQPTLILHPRSFSFAEEQNQQPKSSIWNMEHMQNIHQHRNHTPSDHLVYNPNDFDEMTLESHLLNLSNLYHCGFSMSRDLVSVNPARRIYHGGPPLSSILIKAICFHSTFLSNSAYLLNGVAEPTFAYRLNLAERRFKIDWQTELYMQKNKQSILNHQDLCDLIRALLVHSHSLFSLGRIAEAALLTDQAVELARENYFFDAETFVDNDKIFGHRLLLNPQFPARLSAHDKHERLSILVMCLLFDSFATMANHARKFRIDDGNLPLLDYQAPGPIHLPHPSQYVRFSMSNLGFDTIWNFSPFSTLYDDIQETNIAMESLAVEFSMVKVYGMLDSIKLLRKIMSFIRQDPASISPQSRVNDIMRLHQGILLILSRIPSDVMPVAFFEMFADPVFARGGCRPPTIGGCSSDMFQFQLLILCMLSYLHTFNLHSSAAAAATTALANDGIAESGAPLSLPTFPLDLAAAASPSGAQLYSSQEILVMTIRALDFLLQKAYTPVVNSIFGPFSSTLPFQAANRSISQPLHPSLPSPLLFETSTGMLMYVVAASCIQGIRFSNSKTKTPGDAAGNSLADAHLEQTMEILSTAVVPCLTRIAGIWPGARVFVEELILIMEE